MSHSQTKCEALLQSDDWDGPRFALGAYYRDGDHALLRESVVPSVTSSVLNHAVSHFEKNLSSVVQFQIDLARDNDIDVHRVGSVHTRMIRFQDVYHLRQLLLNFFESRRYVDLINGSCRIRW